ncbi:MAG: hypothetical protein ACQEQP_01105 [Bacillota bacterium]
MKENLAISDSKTIELLCDPFTIDIINTLEMNPLSKNEIAEKLNESSELISKYVDKMEEGNLLKKTDKGFKLTAKSFTADGNLNLSSARNAQNNISGFINHLENNLRDQIEILADLKEKDPEKAKTYTDQQKIGYSPLYLSKDEIKELKQLIDGFIKEKSQENRINDNKYNKCRFYHFIYPEIDRSK